MALKEFSEHQVPMLNLNNEEGNVFVLMGIVSNLSRKLDKDSKAIIAEMTSADYKNAVYVFNREFGDFFDIVLPRGITKKDLESAHKKATLGEEKIAEIYER